MLRGEGWNDDTPGHMEPGVANTGWAERKAECAQGKILDTFSQVHTDITKQGRYVVPGVKQVWCFARSTDSFVIMKPVANVENYKVEVVSATLYQIRPEPTSTAALEWSKNERTTLHTYPIRRVDLKTYNIPAGVRSHNIENIGFGRMPEQMKKKPVSHFF